MAEYEPPVITARFWVQRIVKTKVNTTEIQREVFLAPVVRPTPDNIDWAKYTPSGEIRLVITNPTAGQWYEDRLGKDIAIVMADPIDPAAA